MRWTCVRTTSLLGNRPAGLSPVERLAIEDHLGQCVSCRETARLGDAFRHLANAEPQHGGSITGSIDRAISRAMTATEDRPVSRPQLATRIGVGALVVAALAGIVVVVARSRSSSTPREPVAVQPTRIVSDPAHGKPIVGTTDLTLAHAEVRLIDGELVWNAATSTVTLSRGSVDVVVDRATGRSFRVATERFVVDVIGTKFRVDATGVEVHEGRVRIVAPDGGVLAASVGAGEVWRVTAIASETSLQDVARTDSVRIPPSRTASRAPQHIARARAHLASRDTTAARKEIELALAARPTRSERADASILRAEAAFVEGNNAKAIELYLEIHESFADIVAGETALFAAARLEVRTGRRDAARKLLDRYLQRYPKGHFSREVATRLRELDSQP